jgi:hypothetical protein
MTTGLRAVAVKRFPDELSVKLKLTFLHEISGVMNATAPPFISCCIVSKRR